MEEMKRASAHKQSASKKTVPTENKTLSKKITRPMNVTMDEEEFEKFDKGITHSKNGVRDASGQLSALPDISPLTNKDLPQPKTVVVPAKQTASDMVKEAVINGFVDAAVAIGTEFADKMVDKAVDVVFDPHTYQVISEKSKHFWHSTLKPAFHTVSKLIKNKTPVEIKATQLVAKQKEEASYEASHSFADEQSNQIFEVTPEEAAALVEKTRDSARNFATMIYILSQLSVKDKKSDEELKLEQSYIKQLMSEECRAAVQWVCQHPDQVDEMVAVQLREFQEGYIRSGEQLIEVSQIRRHHSKDYTQEPFK